MSGAVVRDYRVSDYERVKEIHESTQIDYQFPDIASPLFLVKKVLEVDGIVRMCIGCYVQAEAYLWADQSDWADPEQKLAAIQALDGAGVRELYLKGIDQAVLWLPPGMERFGERLVDDLGFTKDRDGWVSYSKKI
jgi:hypothetical protein